jgi:hypothetical protein
MSDLQSLREVEGIRVRRLQAAEDALRAAQLEERRAKSALNEAKFALEDYQQRLPGLIEQLYVDCIGFVVSREFVQEKTFEEKQLRAKVEDFKAKVVEAEHVLEKAIEAVKQAQIKLNQERTKLDALKELITSEKKKIKLAAARAEAKVLDDLAGSKFVRRMAALAA